MMHSDYLLGITNQNFEARALELFHLQYERVEVYRHYVDLL